MNKRLLVLIYLLAHLHVHADARDTRYNSCNERYNEESCFNNNPFTSFSWQTNGMFILPACIKNYDDKMSFAQFDSAITVTYPLHVFSGAMLSMGCQFANINWDENPIFQEQNIFKYIMLAAGSYSICIPNWNWSILLSALMDADKFLSIEYGLYYVTIWGKYKVSDALEIHTGIINETGLRQEKIWPLLGISYNLQNKCLINIIYPINFSIDYTPNNTMSIGSAFKIVRFRKRLNENKTVNKGILAYNAKTLEANCKISPSDVFSIKCSAGAALNSNISVANKKNTRLNLYKFSTTPFMSVMAAISF